MVLSAVFSTLLLLTTLPTGIDTGYISGLGALRLSVNATGTHNLTLTGLGASDVSMNWTPDAAPCVNYVLQESTAGPLGPWSVASVNGVAVGNSSYIYDQPPGGSTWWEVVYERGIFHPRTECSRYAPDNVSSVLEVTQANASILTGSEPNATTVNLTWTNSAAYTGHVAFESYDVLESINGTAFTPIFVITTPWTRGVSVQGILPRISYSFYVNITDGCVGCTGGPYFSTSSSNVVNVGPPSPLRAIARADRARADVGQSVLFTCTAIGGGVSPSFNYLWTFGDGSNATGASVSYTYAAPGQFAARCTTTNATGARATATVNVSVSTDPQVGGATVSPISPEVGQSVRLSVGVSGGSGSYTIRWTGLPLGCSGLDSPDLNCTPSATGSYDANVSVTDANQYVSSLSLPEMTVVSGPAVTSFYASTTNVTVSQPFSLTVAVSGGSAPYSFDYSGLPPGCSDTGSPSVECTVSTAGNYTVRVTATDGVGVAAAASLAVVVKALPPAPQPPTHSSPSWATLGLAVFAAIGVLSTVLLLRARRNPRLPSIAAPHPPDRSGGGQERLPAESLPRPFPAPVVSVTRNPSEIPHASSASRSLIHDVEQQVQAGHVDAAIVLAFESVVASLVERSRTPTRPDMTYQDLMTEVRRPELGRLPVLLERLYRMYEPVRYGSQPVLGVGELSDLVREILEQPVFRS